MVQPISRTQDAVAQARTALRRMELAIRKARFDRTDEPAPAYMDAQRRPSPHVKRSHRD
ncbi:MAG: hypothetical protein QF733_10175 [Phycisphaerales bacterium]|jgi:hypothetical protein|nr:hypothetical protein [Phycisphaerales bacterium]